jgi:threonine synthase
VILPVGNGTLFLGAYIGFGELLKNNIIETLPKLVGVQAANCSPLYKAFKSGSTEVQQIKTKKTIADGIEIAEPARGNQILKAVKKVKGEILAVKETEIKKSLIEITKLGHTIEPTAAATTAGITQYLEKYDPSSDEVIVSAFTGHGSNAEEKIKKIIS